MPLKTYTYDDLLNGTADTDSNYCLQSEADEEIRRLNKLLWESRARAARYVSKWWFSSLCGISPTGEKMINIWKNVERLCLKKSREFK
jgi:hypothetical protein